MRQISTEINEETRRLLRQYAANPGRALGLAELRHLLFRLQISLGNVQSDFGHVCGHIRLMGWDQGLWKPEVEFAGYPVGRKPFKGQKISISFKRAGVKVVCTLIET